jgi:hypothetical protein
VCLKTSGKELQSDDAFELGVFRLIDNAHASFAELLENSIM